MMCLGPVPAHGYLVFMFTECEGEGQLHGRHPMRLSGTY